MIVRISGQGQFKLPDEDEERLNELDNRAVSAVEQGDVAEGEVGVGEGEDGHGGRRAPQREARRRLRRAPARGRRRTRPRRRSRSAR